MRLSDPFAFMWAELARRLAPGERAFAWEPHRWTLRQHAANGMILWITEDLGGGPPAICPSDPTWSDPDAEEEGPGSAAIVAIWPELAPRLPRDGRLRAVATIAFRLRGEPNDRHQIREIDLDTLTMGAPLDVLPFGASGVH